MTDAAVAAPTKFTCHVLNGRCGSYAEVRVGLVGFRPTSPMSALSQYQSFDAFEPHLRRTSLFSFWE